MTDRNIGKLIVAILCLFAFLISFVFIRHFFALNIIQIINLSLFITVISSIITCYYIFKPESSYIPKSILIIMVLFLLLLIIPVKFESRKIEDFKILKGENYIFIEVLDESVNTSKPYIINNSIKLYKKRKEEIILYEDVSYSSLNDKFNQKLRYEIKN